MELLTDYSCTHVDLTILNFFELPVETGDSLTSPEFRFAGDTYCLRFSRNGDAADTDLELVRLSSSFAEQTVFYRVGYGWSEWPTYPNSARPLVGEVGFCVSRSKLEEEKHLYALYGPLNLVLFLRLEEQSTAGVGTYEAAQKWTGLPGIHKLQCDYRQLLQKGTESDACFVVRGKEFHVHRNVLRARSTSFDAMFGHETTEKESGRLVVDDLDPDSFGDFLEYLYTGGIQAGLSEDNTFGLYAAAYKYDVSTLKSDCFEHIRRTLSVDSFCDVMTLALRYSEEELLQQAISFFKDNLQRITITLKWQQFNIDNGASVNEFLLNASVPGTQ